MRRILILEDEENIRSFIVLNLRRSGYAVVEAATGEEALRKLQRYPDIGVAILDIMLPGIDGFEVCRQIRASGMQIGIIMLTARTQETDKINGLLTGADDYVTKPFSPMELTARIDALFRRIRGESPTGAELLRSGVFTLNTVNHTLLKDGNLIKLTQIEYAILHLFLQNPGRSLSREEILEKVWGRDYAGDIKVVDVNIRRLRLKIEDDATKPAHVVTVWGFGYQWI